MERTLIILKPDAVQRGLSGEILSRFERKGIQIVGMKFIKIPTSLAETTAQRTPTSRAISR